MSQDNDRPAAWRARGPRPVFGVFTAAVLLGGCSAVPDWADPTDWFAEDAAPTQVGCQIGCRGVHLSRYWSPPFFVV